ncbi:MAG: HlyC/CorC family transporter [Clostridia bacterium]|nr:HlyC/CorC family transporter [Clostridia bacterium]
MLVINSIALGILFALGILIKLTEVSVGTASESELTPLIQNGSKRAKRVLELAKKQLPFASSLKTAISVIEFLMAALTAVTFAPYISLPLVKSGMHEALATFIAITAIVLIFVLLTVILIAIIARHIAIKHSLKISLALSGFACFISKLFLPMSALISAIAGGALTLMGINHRKQESDVSEKTIKMMVDAGSEMGTIDTEEKEFIENVFAFDDLSASEVATHRTGITLLWTDESDEEWEKTIYSSHHTYFPVCEDKIDNVIGVLNSKEYFRLKDHSRESVMKRAVKTPYFIPVSMKANAILKDMKKKREYFAVVIDEYGGLNGIVTVTDLLQCIVGDIFEDTDTQSLPEIERLDSKSFMILGSAPLEDVEEALGLTLNEDFDTFAGYVLTMMEDSIPDDGAVVNVENDLMTVRITAIKDRRIQKTMVQLKEVKAED